MSSTALGAQSTPYAGDISPKEAWKRLENEPRAQLIDVRTEAEWAFVGRPDLAAIGKTPLFVQWEGFPGKVRNSEFVAALAARVQPEQVLLFLCRSGGRSRAAAQAMTAAGYKHCYNVAGGFEGDLDAARHRGRASSWKGDGLPWVQE